jgi:hypothetical protein
VAGDVTPVEAERARMAEVIPRWGSARHGDIGVLEFARTLPGYHRWDTRFTGRARRELERLVAAGVLVRGRPENGTAKYRGCTVTYSLSGAPVTIEGDTDTDTGGSPA